MHSMMMAVNSPPVVHRDVPGGPAPFRPYNDDYETIHQRVEKSVPLEDQDRIKKDKKWSFGKLFRRKKKGEESSSSESDDGVSTRAQRKLKKKKRTPVVNNFDHIVIRDTRRAQSVAKPVIRDLNDEGVLSDPSAGFINYRLRTPKQYHGESKESLPNRDDLQSRSPRINLESTSKRTRKGRLKARVEALRNSLKGDSSSDEESLKSSNSSSMIRFRSDESLMRYRDSSLNKKSRAARNERYIKRLSRDDENQLNKEAELLQQGYTKAEIEMFTRTPTSQSSGYGTCKRDQVRVTQEQIYANELTRQPLKSESISSFPSTQSYPSSINFNAKVNNENLSYSIQCNNLNRNQTMADESRHRGIGEDSNIENVITVKFPLGNVTNTIKDENSPPVPPPRDLQRKVATPISMYYENNPIVADRMDYNNKACHGVQNNDFERVMRRSHERSIGQGSNGLRRPISNSEDHIAMMNNEYLRNFQHKTEQPRRPASVSAEPNHYVLYRNAPQWQKQQSNQNKIVKPEPVQLRQDYLYYADQSPRSRKPISIKNGLNGYENQYLSDSQSSLNARDIYRKPRNASEFWKKLDDAERQKKQQYIYAHHRTNSDNVMNTHFAQPNRLSRTYSSDIQNRNTINSNCQDTIDGARSWKATTEYKRSCTEPPSDIILPKTETHIRHQKDTPKNSVFSDEEKSSERRKSTNLDDALNELEAIYNSLGLGDEDLLDRAEQRESMLPKYGNNYNDWNGNDEQLALRSQPTTPLKRVPRRSTLPDKLQDDMAFRRLNTKDKQSQYSNDAQSQISYMLASPAYVPYVSDDEKHSDRNEPDIVYDDMVYRNIKQTNNRLKVMDPQPPFGIPVGPVTPAPQSDYLHATPENKGRSRFIPRRSPDLVSDDLAYRNLRKDNRHSSVFNRGDFNGHLNNNHDYSDSLLVKELPTDNKKRRAIRSMSANIFTLIQKEIDDALNMSKLATIQKTQSNGDVTRKLRETFENNDNSKDDYPRNKVKQRHHTVNLYVNNIHAPNHHFAKDDSYIHSDEKYLSKPPYCDKSKSSSPSNRSPQFTKRSSKNEFQHVLTMLAQEAMDTSNKLGVALAELDKNRNQNDRKTDIQSKISDSRTNFLNGLTNKTTDLHSTASEVFVNAHTETVKEAKIEKLTNIESKAKKTEDSLMEISNQLNKVEDQLKHSIEKEVMFVDESKKLTTYLNQTDEQPEPQECNVVTSENKYTSNITPANIQNDSVKIEVIKIEDLKHEDDLKIINKTTLEPSSENHIRDMNEIQAFKELKNGISDLIAGISEVNEKLCIPKPQKTRTDSQSSSKTASITEATAKLEEVVQNAHKNEVLQNKRTSINLSIYDDDLLVKKDGNDSTEYNSSEELATIFKTSSSTSHKVDGTENSVRSDLSSPKLVKTMNQQLRRLSVDKTEDTPSQSNSLPTNIVPWRKRHSNAPKESRGEN